jgi:hypothetical protein
MTDNDNDNDDSDSNRDYIDIDAIDFDDLIDSQFKALSTTQLDLKR